MNFKPNKISISNKNSFKLGKKYELFVSRESCLMRCEVYNHWLIDHGVNSLVIVPKGKTYEYYHEQKSWNEFLRNYAKWLVKNYTKHLKRYPLAKKKLLESAKKLSQVSKKGNRQAILKSYEDYLNKAYDFCEYIWSPWGVIYILEPQTIPKIKNSEVVTSLDRPIEYFKMQKDLFKFSPKQMVEKYGWLNVYIPRDNPFAEKDFVKMKQNLNWKDLQSQEQNFLIIKKQFNQLLAKLSKNLQKPASLIHEYTFLKTDRIDTWKQTNFDLRDLCRYLSSISDIPFEDVCFLSMSEVIAVLKGKNNIDLKSLWLRGKNKVVYVLEKGEEFAISNQAAIQKIGSQLLNQEKQVKEIKGIPANAGIAKGRVRIVLHSQDVKKVKKGDIFVASYTFPSFTPYMNISSAIITDEGGMTSHAAIVSRELGVPCIVGTKIATKVFKDGDLVEVDANKGIVRRLADK